MARRTRGSDQLQRRIFVLGFDLVLKAMDGWFVLRPQNR
jgi:hypothetical protein